MSRTAPPCATVVLIHGPFLGPWIWHEDVVLHLSRLGLACFTPDLEECWPQTPEADRSHDSCIAQAVERLADFLTRIEGPIILVGHSLGARVVEGLIARGHRTGAVLISPPPPQGLEEEARAFLGRYPVALARVRMAQRPLLWFGEPGEPDPQRLRALLGPRASEALLAQVGAALRDTPLDACLEAVRPAPGPRPQDVPVLVLSGREDPLVTPAALRRTAVAWNAVAHVLPHAGHWPMLGPTGPVLARHIGRWLFED